jgi:type I restriction enzyme S subunit
LKSTWQYKKINEIAQHSLGKMLDKAKNRGEPKPYLRNLNVRWFGFDLSDLLEMRFLPTEAAKYMAQKGDVLICEGGYPGRAAIWDQDYPIFFQKALHRVRFHRPEHNKWFLYYLYKLDLSGELKDHFRGTGIQHFTGEALSQFEVPIPPYPEQQRIVGILDDAFDGIAIAKANAAKNLQNARALFESHMNSVFSECRKGWTVLPIGEVAEVFDGPHATPKTVDAGPIFLGISAIQDGKINLGETRHVTPDDFKRWTRRVRPRADDVVFSYETRLGQAAIIPRGIDCCLGRRMGLVRANRKRLSPHFFVYQYISPPFQAFLNSRTIRGATVDRIALKEFPSFPIMLPSLDEQDKLATQFELLRKETQRLESIYQRKLGALEELKKSLLHSAFSGNL